MSVQINDMLKIAGFVRKYNLNPQNVLYRKIPASVASINDIQFTIKNPAKGRALCFGLAKLETQVTFVNVSGANAATVLQGAQDDRNLIARKPGLSLQANSVSEATIR